MGAFCHRWYSFRRVGQGVFDRETTRDSLDLGQIGQVVSPAWSPRQICCGTRLEDIQHQVQSNCLELPISLSDGV
jgi:hypothetical protein